MAALPSGNAVISLYCIGARMLDMLMSSGLKKRDPSAKLLAVTGVDLLGNITTPVYAVDDTYAYLIHNATSMVYRAPLATLLDGTLNFSTLVTNGPVVGSMLARAPFNPVKKTFMFAPATPATRHLFVMGVDGKVVDTGLDTLPGYGINSGMGQIVVGGNLYTFGGYTQQTPAPSMAVYRTDGTTRVLDSTGVLPTPRTTMMVATDGVDIYSAGGFLVPVGSSYPLSNELWKYSTVTHTWTKLANLPQTLRISGNCEIIKGKLYIFGGATTENVSQVSDVLYVYDIASDKWSTWSFPAIGPRYYLMGFSYREKLYLYGGFETKTGTSKRSGELWEITV